MEIFLAAVGAVGTPIMIVLAYLQLRRTPKPKPEPEPITPTSLTILGAPMDHGPDLVGKDRWGSKG